MRLIISTSLACGLSIGIFSQSIDFGFDIKINQNFLHNRTLQYEIDSAIVFPRIHFTNADEIVLPEYNFAFQDDYNDTVYVRFNQLNISNNFELPLSFRFNTKTNWYFDLQLSLAKYTMDYEGIMFQNKAYYWATYGTLDDYLIANNGQGYQPIVGPSVNNSAAYAYWFNEQVENDPWTQATVRYQEQIRFRTAYLGVGYKFLPTATINPYVYLGLGYKLAVGNFKRSHIEIDEPFLNLTSKRDLTGISDQLPTFSNQSFSIRADLGAKFYRYRLGFTGELTLNQTDKDNVSFPVFNYETPGIGFITFGAYLGADLQSFNINSKDERAAVYEDEYSALSSGLIKNRRWAFAISLEAPVHSGMNMHEPFTFIDYQEVWNPYTDTATILWNSITFQEVTKINWSPKLKLGLRYSPSRKFDIEIQFALNRLETDIKTIAVNAEIALDTTTQIGSFVQGRVSANNMAYRINYIGYGANLNLYYTLFSRPLLDIRVHAGGGLTYASEINGAETTFFGVNGEGFDAYDIFNDYYWGYWAWYLGHSYFRSTYGGNPNVDGTVSDLWDPYFFGSELTAENPSPRSRPTFYYMANVGVEVEFNRFLFGVSSEFSLVDFDKILINRLYNVNLSLGYVLFSKSKLIKKTNQAEL